MTRKVLIQLSNNPIQLLPGQSAELVVTLTNQTGILDSFELSIREFEPGWVRFEPAPPIVQLSPEAQHGTDQAEIKLYFTIPPNAAPTSYAPRLEVHSRSQNDLVGNQVFVLTVIPPATVPPDVLLAPDRVRTKAGVARYQLRFRNPSDRAASLKLFAQSENQLTHRATVSPIQVDLGPGGEGAALVEVTAYGRNLIRADDYLTFRAGVVDLATARGLLERTCAWPWLRWLLTKPLGYLPLILLPLILLGSLLYWLWPNPDAYNYTQVAAQPAAVCYQFAPDRIPYLQPGPQDTSIMVKKTDGANDNILTANSAVVGKESALKLPGLFEPLLSISPDNKLLAYVTASNQGLDNAQLIILNMDSGTKERVISVPTGLWIKAPLWSPDNRLAYLVVKDKQLRIWTLDVASRDQREQILEGDYKLAADLFYGEPKIGPLCWSNQKGDNRLILLGEDPNTQLEISPLTKQFSPPKLRPQQNKFVPGQDTAGSGPKTLRPSLQAEKIKTPQLTRPLEDRACFVRPFSQNDPEWRDQTIGPKKEVLDKNNKLGGQGCAIASAAMLLNYNKAGTDPSRLNDCLGAQADPLQWLTVTDRCRQDLPLGIQGVKSDGTLQEFDWKTLDGVLKTGQPAIVGLVNFQSQVHYVVVLSGQDGLSATYRVNDPWDGSSNKSLAQFTRLGYQPRYLLNLSAEVASGCIARLEPAEKFEPGYTLLQPEDGKAYNTPVRLSIIPQLSGGRPVSLTYTLKPLVKLDSATAGEAMTSLPIAEGTELTTSGVYSLEIATFPDATATRPTYLRTISFVIDNTAPVVKVSRLVSSQELSDPANPKQILSSIPVSIEVTATDDLSGVASLEYSINDLNNWKPYTGPVNLKDQATYTVNFQATDIAGNKGLLTPPLQITISPPVIPTPSPVPPPPPIELASAPAALTFDGNAKQLNVQVTNKTAEKLTWEIFQPLPAATAAYLKISPLTGEVGPNGSFPLTVELTNLNLKDTDIIAPINIKYSNGPSIQFLPINTTIKPQPKPNIQFTSPQSGPLIGSSVDIKMVVTKLGQAELGPANVKVQYKNTAGQVEEANLLASPGEWKATWSFGGLLPQSGITVSASVCWLAEPTVCANTAQPLSLSIPGPTVSIKVTPEDNKLVGPVTLSAVINGTPPPDLTVNYTYVYTVRPNDAEKTQTIGQRGDATNNFTVKFDPSLIPPPQNGVLISANICWNGTSTCIAPTNQLSPLVIEQPQITINPLGTTDISSSVVLSGTVSKLLNIGNPGLAPVVWVEYSAIKATGGKVEDSSVPAVLTTTGPGAGTWQVSIDTRTWPSQNLNFNAKVCWDGNRTGENCFPATPIVSQIADLSAPIVAPDSTVLSKPIAIKTLPVPVGRVSTVQFVVSIDNFKTPITLSKTGTVANNFTILFDSLEMGLAPGMIVSIKTQACNSTGFCGTLSPNPLLTLTVPESTLDSLTTVGTLNPLSPTLAVQATVKGRTISELSLLATYKNPLSPATIVTTTIGTTTGALLDQQISYSWNTAGVPPQPDIKLSYQLCWGPGEINPFRVCIPKPALTGLGVTSPLVTKIIVNGGAEFDTANSFALPYDKTTPASNLKIPLVAAVSGSNVTGVKWKLVVNPDPGGLLFEQVASTSGGSQSSQIWFNLNLQDLKARGVNLATAAISIQAQPIWNNKETFSDPANIKQLKLKLVSTTFDVSRNGLQNLIGSPPLNDSRKILLSKISTFLGTLENSGGVVKKIVFEIYTGGSTSPLSLSTAPVFDASSGTWQLSWNHSTDTPALSPQTNLSIGWRFCSTTDDSGCLPASTDNGLPRITGLTLGGIRFVPGGNPEIPPFQNNNPVLYFHSSFVANVETSLDATTPSFNAATQIRYYAYPTGSPTAGNRIPLLLRPELVPNGTNRYRMNIYWPEDHPNFANFLSAASSGQVSLGLQICANDAGPTPDDALCSDWSGREIATFNPAAADKWQAAVAGKMGVISTWQPYDGSSDRYPYNTLLQAMVSLTDHYKVRTLTLRIRRVQTSFTVSSVVMSYSSTTATTPVNKTATVSLNSGGTEYAATFPLDVAQIFTASAGLQFPIDSTDTTFPPNPNTRSVTLDATIIFNGAANADRVSTLTGGRTSNYALTGTGQST